jgi:GNAT superfamily N-acetyltransferase
MTDNFLGQILFTGFQPEAAIQVIPILANFFLRQYAGDEEFRDRLTKEVETYLVELDNPRNGAVCAWVDKKLAGAVFIDAAMLETHGAWIRWFVVDEKFRGQGLGQVLFEKALEHCRERAWPRITIRTFKSVDPAVELYQRMGFRLFQERDFSTGKSQITEQWFEKRVQG